MKFTKLNLTLTERAGSPIHRHEYHCAPLVCLIPDSYIVPEWQKHHGKNLDHFYSTGRETGLPRSCSTDCYQGCSTTVSNLTWSSVPLTRLDHLKGSDTISNFTTFPRNDKGAPFRFLHAGRPAFRESTYRPHISFSYELWRRNRLGFEAWDRLVDWTTDINSRAAWTRPVFALMDEGISFKDTK